MTFVIWFLGFKKLEVPVQPLLFVNKKGGWTLPNI